MKPFRIEVPDLMSSLLELVQQIPRGRVATFGDVATALGDRTAARWVAKVLSEPPEPVRGLTHRIVKVTGEPGRFPADALARLRREGSADKGGRVKLERRFDDFVGDRPLARLEAEQRRLGEQVRQTKRRSMPRTVAAVDVSYRPEGVGVGAYVLMAIDCDDPLAVLTVEQPAAFPYVTGYLAYRELPIYAALIREVIAADLVAPLLLVDGHGISHPRRAGIASQLGVLTDHPTIGIGKHRLCGSVVQEEKFGPGSGSIVDRDETIGAVLPALRGHRPIYVSPGHRCTLADAVRVVTEWRRGKTLPEPIRLADAHSRAVAKGGLEASG